MRAPNVTIGGLILAFVGSGCASVPAPAPLCPGPDQVQESAFGVWIEIESLVGSDPTTISSTATVLEPSLAIRSFPIAGSEPSATLQFGDKLTIIDRSTSSGKQWYLVETSDGRRGWVLPKELASQQGVPRIQGELIAFERDSVFVMTPSQLVSVSATDIVSARLYTFAPNTGSLALWTFVGVLSTASHGAGLVLSLPVWIIAGTASAVSESHSPEVKVPGRSWEYLRMFARFPQGLPPGLDRSALIYGPAVGAASELPDR